MNKFYECDKIDFQQMLVNLNFISFEPFANTQFYLIII